MDLHTRSVYKCVFSRQVEQIEKCAKIFTLSFHKSIIVFIKMHVLTCFFLFCLRYTQSLQLWVECPQGGCVSSVLGSEYTNTQNITSLSDSGIIYIDSVPAYIGQSVTETSLVSFVPDDPYEFSWADEYTSCRGELSWMELETVRVSFCLWDVDDPVHVYIKSPVPTIITAGNFQILEFLVVDMDDFYRDVLGRYSVYRVRYGADPYIFQPSAHLIFNLTGLEAEIYAEPIATLYHAASETDCGSPVSMELVYPGLYFGQERFIYCLQTNGNIVVSSLVPLPAAWLWFQYGDDYNEGVLEIFEFEIGIPLLGITSNYTFNETVQGTNTVQLSARFTNETINTRIFTFKITQLPLAGNLTYSNGTRVQIDDVIDDNEASTLLYVQDLYFFTLGPVWEGSVRVHDPLSVHYIASLTPFTESFVSEAIFYIDINSNPSGLGSRQTKLDLNFDYVGIYAVRNTTVPVFASWTDRDEGVYLVGITVEIIPGLPGGLTYLEQTVEDGNFTLVSTTYVGLTSDDDPAYTSISFYGDPISVNLTLTTLRFFLSDSQELLNGTQQITVIVYYPVVNGTTEFDSLKSFACKTIVVYNPPVIKINVINTFMLTITLSLTLVSAAALFFIIYSARTLRMDQHSYYKIIDAVNEMDAEQNIGKGKPQTRNPPGQKDNRGVYTRVSPS